MNLIQRLRLLSCNPPGLPCAVIKNRQEREGIRGLISHRVRLKTRQEKDMLICEERISLTGEREQTNVILFNKDQLHLEELYSLLGYPELFSSELALKHAGLEDSTLTHGKRNGLWYPLEWSISEENLPEISLITPRGRYTLLKQHKGHHKPHWVMTFQLHDQNQWNHTPSEPKEEHSCSDANPLNQRTTRILWKHN